MGAANPLKSDENASGAAGRSHGDAPLEEVVDQAIASAEGDRVTMRNILVAWDDRSYGPLFILLGFVGGTPLAAIPGAAAVVGIVVTILALQMALGLNHPWLPAFVLRQSVSAEKLRTLRRKSEKVLVFLDSLITERLVWATGDAMRRMAALIVAALGVVMIPFDAIPFAVAAPAWTVVLFGVAITARDGLVLLVGVAACFAIAFLGFRIFT